MSDLDATGAGAVGKTAEDQRNPLFTASQIAACLGKTPQAVRKALQCIQPCGKRIVAGNEAAAWSIAKLPASTRSRLSEEAARRHYRTAEAMLSDPPKIWQPEFPLNKIAQVDIDHALNLRTALKPFLVGQRAVSSAELEAEGVESYVRQFGHKITGRYWRELFMRTLRRDGGADNFDRLEIYLPEHVSAKAALAQSAPVKIGPEFSGIESFIAACGNPARPSDTEQRAIWSLALGQYAWLVRNGMPQKRAARKVRSFLFSRATFLAPSRDALLKAFNRKLEALEKSGGDPKALRDGREENGESFQLPEIDRDMLIHRAVFTYRGDVAPAWRELLEQGFSEPIRQRYAGRAGRKSHVPTSVMNSVSAEVEIMTVMHRGPRAFDSIKGHVNRSYEGIASLKCMVADDFTMPVYFYVPDGNGGFNLTRGQILIFTDFRTLRILGWSLQPDRNYSSLTIRSLCTHVFSEFGLPNVLQFERGIWECSTLLKGRDSAPFQFTEVVQGLHEFGIHFIHSIRPRSKTVERVGGLLQDLMESEPGYCGRDERKDAPESLRLQMREVTTRKTHPSKYFYSYDAWNRRFGEIVSKYNAAPQQGKILGGFSPDQALVEFADADDPPMQFSGQVRYLLAHDKRVLPVTLNGVTFSIGAKKFNYRSKELGRLIGKQVMIWFDPENPETVVVTDMNRKNPICVARSCDPSALECLVNPESETLSRELRRVEDQASYIKTRFHAVKSKFPLPQRQLLVDARTLELGQTIEAQKAEVRTVTEKRRRLGSANRDKARKLDIPPALVGDDDESRMALDLIESAKRENSRQREREMSGDKESQS